MRSAIGIGSALIIIVLLIILFVFRPLGTVAEGFVASKGTGVAAPAAVTFCPGSSKQYINKNGDVMCCSGEVDGQFCNGDVICTFATPKSGVPSCAEIYREYAAAAAAKYCPKEMPNYFEMRDRGLEGCTVSGLRAGTYEPLNTTAEHCLIYKTAAENNKRPDSCLNMKRMSEMKCVTPNCKKFVDGALVGQMFKIDGQLGMRACYSRESASNAGITMANNDINICDVAYKKYVEKRAI